MITYDITVAKSAFKELEKLDNLIIERIISKIETLSVNPRPTGCIKLHGTNILWRIRVGDYRVLYSIDDNQRLVDVIAIKHRKKAYQ